LDCTKGTPQVNNQNLTAFSINDDFAVASTRKERDIAMKTNLVRPLVHRRAFTLVELIVVLTILVGLAGVLIPAVTDMISRTNRSTSAANISEVAGAIQRYDAQYMSYPNNFDSLMMDVASGGLAGGDDLDTLTTELGTASADVTLTAETVATLAAAGITSVGLHVSEDATFDLPTPTTLAVGDKLKGPTAATQQALGLETTGVSGKYVLLGVGALSDMNGKTMIDAPVHFPRNSTTNPETAYARFIAVFQITDGTALPDGALTRAKFAGVIAPDGLGLSDELDGYFQTASSN
jgi:prepilin-type N-terminal cleavage/methylation domain-containing protein